MKFPGLNRQIFLLGVFLVLTIAFGACSVIGEIFKAGVQVGIFLVIVLIVIILILINRFKKR